MKVPTANIWFCLGESDSFPKNKLIVCWMCGCLGETPTNFMARLFFPPNLTRCKDVGLLNETPRFFFTLSFLYEENKVFYTSPM